jgi:putative Mg2+ transporter-C (MgtC) family protein
MAPTSSLQALPTVIAAGQGPKQIGELALAFALSTLIGLEREWRQKSAGLRTHTLVGVGAALFMLVSKYGFGDVLVPGGRTVLDPSRIAAQVVSGIGFIGGGLIFVRGDIVRGLTTAAIVWVTAAVGMACGAGLALLACATTAGHFAVVLGYPAISSRLPASRPLGFAVRIVYEDGRGILRDVLGESTRGGFAVQRVTTQPLEARAVGGVAAVAVTLEVQGQPGVEGLVTTLDELPGVLEVSTTELGRDAD